MNAWVGHIFYVVWIYSTRREPEDMNTRLFFILYRRDNLEFFLLVCRGGHSRPVIISVDPVELGSDL